MLLAVLLWINCGLMLNRLVQRSVCVSRVYGPKHLWLLPIRWPISVFVNSLACFNALFQTLSTRIKRKQFQWIKTEHELPLGFGQEGTLQSVSGLGERRVG